MAAQRLKVKGHMKNMIPSQCRAARAMLGWSQDRLAEEAEVSKPTIADFEREARTPMLQNLQAMRRALESAGLEFIDENGGGVGVRFRLPAAGSAAQNGE